MKKKIFNVVKYLLILVIALGLVWWQLSGMTAEEKEQFAHSLQNVNYFYVGIVVVLGIFSHLFRALRWQILIEPIRSVSTENTFYATLVGYLGNTFVPRAGEVLRCSLLGKYEKLSFTKLLGTVITERVFDLVCFLIVILLALFSQLKTIGSFLAARSQKAISNDKGISLTTKLMIAAAAGIIVYFVFKWLFKHLEERKVISKLKTLWGSLKEGVGTILHMEKKQSFMVYTALIWLMYLLQIYIGFRTIEATAGLGLGPALSVLALSTVAMIVSPGGLGAFPVAIQQVLLLYHINNISFGWLVWGANTAIVVIAGSISFLLITLRGNKVSMAPKEIKMV